MAACIIERHQHPDHERLYVLRRDRSKFYYAETFLDGRKARKSLKVKSNDKRDARSLTTAFRLAEEWYRKELRASVQFGKQHPIERLTVDPIVGEVFKSYLADLEPRKQPEAQKRWGPIQHFWRTLTVNGIVPQTFSDFYAWRRKRLKTITPHSLHKDVVLIRQILKYTLAKQYITALPPIIPSPGKIMTNPRPWLTRAEWDKLLQTSQDRIEQAGHNRKLLRQREDLDPFIVFLCQSMMRVGELRGLTVGQCKIVGKVDYGPDLYDTSSKDGYLLIDVQQGKHPHRTVVASGLAARIFEGRCKELNLKRGDRLFPVGQRDAFRELLIAADLRTDAFGNERNLKSIRATSISFAILAGAPTPNLMLIARNAGTSVAMIDQFYAKRLSAELGAAELNKAYAGMVS